MSQSAYQCYGLPYGDLMNCAGRKIIKITEAEYGISKCWDTSGQACCPSAEDCMVQVQNQRLDVIKHFCEGRQTCDDDLVVGSTGPYLCNSTNAYSDYEVIFYECSKYGLIFTGDP